MDSGPCCHRYPSTLTGQGASGGHARYTSLTGLSSSLPSALLLTIVSVNLPEEDAEEESKISFPWAHNKSGAVQEEQERRQKTKLSSLCFWLGVPR